MAPTHVLRCCQRGLAWIPVIFIALVVCWSYYAYVVELCIRKCTSWSRLVCVCAALKPSQLVFWYCCPHSCWPAGSKWTAAQQWCWQGYPNQDMANYLWLSVVLLSPILLVNVFWPQKKFLSAVGIANAARLVSFVPCRGEWMGIMLTKGCLPGWPNNLLSCNLAS